MCRIGVHRLLAHLIVEPTAISNLAGKPEILDHQIDHEAGVVPIAGWRRRHHPWEGVVELQRPVASGAGLEDL